jgi:hypothetical protein
VPNRRGNQRQRKRFAAVASHDPFVFHRSILGFLHSSLLSSVGCMPEEVDGIAAFVGSSGCIEEQRDRKVFGRPILCRTEAVCQGDVVGES